MKITARQVCEICAIPAPSAVKKLPVSDDDYHKKLTVGHKREE